MVNVFISYRRSDSAGYAGRLADSLESLLGSGKVFRDVEDIEPGDDFVQAIEQNLKKAMVFLVVIGKDWLEAKDGQGRRLDNPNDYVRIEIETALRLGGVVIPVLVGGAAMPEAKALPSSIAGLANRQAIEASDSRWEQDIERLLHTLAEHPINKLRDSNKLLSWRPRIGGWLGRLFIVLALSAATALLFFIVKWYLLIPDFSGNWYFERGDYLLIKQEGDHFAVERIDPAMQTTYEKGTGVVKGRRLEFDLEPIYTQQFRYRGELELSWGEERLTGKLTEVLGDETIPVVLARDNPKDRE